MSYKIIKICIVFFGCFLTQGCGQKGPLYLPSSSILEVPAQHGESHAINHTHYRRE
jgi:predicted small lipoprotein YifL